MPRIVRFRELEATWTTRRAREPGFMRWLVTWVGGPAGYINTNPDIAITSTSCAVGMMYLPRGQRQAGKHVHGVTEIYGVLEGALVTQGHAITTIDAGTATLGRLDGLHVPAGGLGKPAQQWTGYLTGGVDRLPVGFKRRPAIGKPAAAD